MASARKRARRSDEYKSVRRVRRAREMCGCETLRIFLLFGRQIGRVPEDIDVNVELKKLRNHQVSHTILTFAEEVHQRSDNFFRRLWQSHQTSGRMTA